MLHEVFLLKRLLFFVHLLRILTLLSAHLTEPRERCVLAITALFTSDVLLAAGVF